MFVGKAIDERFQGLPISDIARDHTDVYVAGGHLLDEGVHAFGRRSATAGEHQLAGAVTRHDVAGDHSTDSTGASRDEDGSVLIEGDWPRQGHLASPARFAGVPQRGPHLANVEACHRQRRQLATRECLRQFRHHRVHPFGFDLTQFEGLVVDQRSP
jgi:hypothetical protein